jgi:hypothetical protein
VTFEAFETLSILKFELLAQTMWNLESMILATIATHFSLYQTATTTLPWALKAFSVQFIKTCPTGTPSEFEIKGFSCSAE